MSMSHIKSHSFTYRKRTELSATIHIKGFFYHLEFGVEFKAIDVCFPRKTSFIEFNV